MSPLLVPEQNMSAPHSQSSQGPSTVNRGGQVLLEDSSDLSEAHLYSKSVRSLSISYRNSPGRQISPEESYFCDYFLLSASLCLEILSAWLIVNKSECPWSALCPDLPLHLIHDTLRSNTVCYSVAPLLTYTFCMITLMTILPSPNALLPALLCSLPYSFPESIS